MRIDPCRRRRRWAWSLAILSSLMLGCDGPDSTPPPLATVSPTPAITATPLSTPSPSPVPSVAPTPSPSTTPQPTPIPSVPPLPTATPTPQPTVPATPLPTTPSPTAAPVPGGSPGRLIQGVVQKGPFVELNMRARRLTPNGPSAEEYPVTVGPQGRYSLRVPNGVAVLLEATGEFIDELTGESVFLGTPLSAVNVDESVQNLNVLTQLLSGQALSQMALGLDPGAALLVARENLARQLGFTPDTSFNQLDIDAVGPNATPDDPNLKLLLLSASVMDLPRPPQGMPEQWNDLNAALAQDPEMADLALFSGQSRQRLIQRLRDAGVQQLPELQLEDGVWSCDAICAFAAAQPGLRIADATVYEGRGRLPITVRRRGDTSAAQDVLVLLEDGSASFRSDYAQRHITLTIPAGETEATAYVDILIDELPEGPETLQARIAGRDPATPVVRERATLTLLDGVPEDLDDTVANGIGLAAACLVAVGAPDALRPAVCQGVTAEAAVLTPGAQALRISAVLEAACLANDLFCAPRRQDWQIDAELLAEDPDGRELGRTRLGRIWYRGLDAQRPDATLDQAPQWLLDIGSAAARGVADQAALAGGELALELTLANPGLNLNKRFARLRIALPQLRRLAGELAFGDRSLPLLPRNTTLDGDDIACTPEEFRLQAEIPSIDPDLLTRLESSAPLPLAALSPKPVDVCVRLEGTAPEMPIVTVGRVDLAQSLWALPPQHGMVVNSGAAVPLLYIPHPAQTRGATLTVEGLPLALTITGGELTPAGLELKVREGEYLHRHWLSQQDERRAQGLNANDFSFAGGAAGGRLRLTRQGLSGQLALLAGQGETSYPQTQVQFPAHSVELEAGTLVGTASLPATGLGLAQRSDCALPGCGGSKPLTYAGQGTLRLDARGRVHGVLTTNRALQPGLGVQDDGSLSISRPDDLPAQATLTAALPGYRFGPDQPVAEQLPGHVEPQAQALQLHPAGSPAYQRGNFAPVGLSFGPELYVAANRQPEVGTAGQDPSGKPLSLSSAAIAAALPTTIAAKYVLRPAGLTGVFNVDGSALATPIAINAYPVRFARFAFQAVDNQIQPQTWLDGQISLEGDFGDPARGAAAPIVFENLAMDCSAGFGQGSLVYERCDDRDDNANAIVDENCPTVLHGFAMEQRLTGLRFADASGGAPAACANTAQTLTLGHSLAAAALDKTVSAEVAWTPAGHLAGYQAFRGLGDVRFEEADDRPGFGLKLSRAELAIEAPNESQRYGRLRGSALVALPFWQGLNADFRVANTLSIAPDGLVPDADDSLLAPAGALFPRSGQAPAFTAQERALSNAELNAKLRDKAVNETGPAAFAVDDDLGYPPNLTFPARYEWGNTGIGFQLPVYFTPPGDNDDTGLATFIGVRRGFDSLVLSVGAGINFIEPERTKLSFGASANIDALRDLEFSIDLGSGQALARIDRTLIRARIIDAPVVEPAFGTIQSKLTAFNDFANTGVDELTERALTLGLEQLGANLAPLSPANEDPLVTLARGLSLVRSLPVQLTALLEDEVTEPLYAKLDRLESELRAPLQQARAELESAGQGARLPQSVFTPLDTASSRFSEAKTTLQREKDRIDGVLAETGDLVATSRAQLQEIDTAVRRVRIMLEQVAGVAAEVCSDRGSVGVELSGFLDRLFTSLDALDTLLTLAEGTAVLEPVIGIAAQDPELAQSMRDAQAAIQNKASLLAEKLTAAEDALRGKLCGTQVDELLVKLTAEHPEPGLLVKIQRQVAPSGPMATALNTLDGRLQDLTGMSAALQASVLDPLAAVDEALTDEINRLRALGQIDQAGSEIYREFDQALKNALSGVTPITLQPFSDTPLRLLFATTVRKADDPERLADLPAVLFGDVRELIDSAVDDAVEKAQAALDERLPGGLYTADGLRTLLVAEIMASPPVAEMRGQVNQQLVELRYQVNSLINDVVDQANTAIRGALASTEERVASLLESAGAPVDGMPLSGGGLDGYATLAGNAIERVHIGAEWALRPSADGQPANTFGAALDAVSWSANDKSEGCSIGPQESPLQITISAFNLPAQIGTSQITMKKVYLGFVVDQASFGDGGGLKPLGVFGGLSTQGEIAFTEFKIYDPAFAAGLGRYENYLGAAAGAVFSTVAAEVAFLVGKTCNQEILLELDPNVAQFIPIPDAGFAGAYVRGAASVPVWSMGCPLTIGVAADFGAWVLAGPPLTVGGLVGGGAFGKVGCIGALRGQVRALGQVNAEGDMLFVGEGFGAAGVGLCEPAGWTSVERSRQDGLCVTGDARFQAGYLDGWQILDLSISAPH